MISRTVGLLHVRGYHVGTMQFKYGKFDGQPFPTPDMLFPSREVVQFILQYGKEALDAMSHLSQEDQQQYIEALIAAGLLERDEETGELHMTPKMVHAIEHESLLEIFEDMKQGTRDGHPTAASGRNDERTDGTKPYEFGDAISQIDLGATMRNALHHARKNNWQPGPAPGSAARSTPGCARIPIACDDFELHQTEGLTDAAVCLLLDLSGSMMRFGRFYYAKQVALGLASLMRDRYPLDTIDFIGFSSVAEPIREMELPLAMPKPVTIFDHEVRMRVPLEQAVQQPGNIPQHFTNLHMGLRMARQVLSGRAASNKQIFIITDGEPTAHIESNPAGGSEMLYLLYPPSEQTSTITLKEALRCQQQGIRLATFALIEDYWGMDWVGFVDKLTRLTRGMSYYCASGDLSSILIESYLSGKKRKSYVG
jgi:uncharacterized protein with von Willebrand factor type A (vWA) domain